MDVVDARVDTGMVTHMGAHGVGVVGLRQADCHQQGEEDKLRDKGLVVFSKKYDFEVRILTQILE